MRFCKRWQWTRTLLIRWKYLLTKSEGGDHGSRVQILLWDAIKSLEALPVGADFLLAFLVLGNFGSICSTKLQNFISPPPPWKSSALFTHKKVTTIGLEDPLSQRFSSIEKSFSFSCFLNGTILISVSVDEVLANFSFSLSLNMALDGVIFS